MRPWFSETLSLTLSTETNALNAIAILKDAPGLTIFAEADPAYNRKTKRRTKPPRPTKLPRKPRKNTKLTGELGEAAFLHAAIHRGLCVARPWGDSRRYDFIIQSSPTSNTFHRIQVKCTESPNARGFQVQSTYCDGKRKGKYTPDDIDFLVAYVIPNNIFYIVPIAACPKSASLRFYPEGSERNQAKLEHYREAWHLLS
jgi:hypothetical protein